MVEKMYGVGVFYEDAKRNSIIPEAYSKAAEESGIVKSYLSRKLTLPRLKKENLSSLLQKLSGKTGK